MGLELVRPGIKPKFEQNTLLLQMLQGTHPKAIIEAAYDKTWGTGIPLDSPDALIDKKWYNKGWMSDTHPLETWICRISINWQHI